MKRSSLRADPEKVREFQQRARENAKLSREKGLKRAQRPQNRRVTPREGSVHGKRRPVLQDGHTEAQWYASKGRRCCRCGARSRLVLHHVIWEQHVRAARGDVFDPRNGLTLCHDCHVDYHAGPASSTHKPIPLRCLRNDTFDFMYELLGAAAYDYLQRRWYSGEDPRLDALLDPGREGFASSRSR